VAYDTASGTQRWVRLFRNPNASDERLYGAALSTDGSRLVLVGRIDRLATNSLDYGTVSINAGTGAVGWVRYHDRGGNDDAANAVAISRDGTRVYVTGLEISGQWAATIAYDAAPGTALWVQREAAHGQATVAVAPDGSTVFLAGRQQGTDTLDHWLIVAYRGTDGAREWVQHFSGQYGVRSEYPYAEVVNPAGTKLYVTGIVAGSDYCYRWATVACQSSTGQQLWSDKFCGVNAIMPEWPDAIALSGDGSKVFVTGENVSSTVVGGPVDFGTVAYSG